MKKVPKEKTYSPQEIENMEKGLEIIGGYLNLLIQHHVDEVQFLNNLKSKNNGTSQAEIKETV